MSISRNVSLLKVWILVLVAAAVLLEANVEAARGRRRRPVQHSAKVSANKTEDIKSDSSSRQREGRGRVFAKNQRHLQLRTR